MDPFTTKCVYETLRCGLVPVKVLKVLDNPTGSLSFEVEVTKTTGAYDKGMKVVVSSVWLHPAANVRRTKGRAFRVTPVTWKV